MMKQKYLPLLLILLVAAIATGAFLWRLGDQKVATIVPSPTDIEPQVAVGGPFSLVDQHGKAVNDLDYRGKYMMVFFGFTYCPDVCPTTLSVMDAVFEKLGAQADKVVPIFITIDPMRDTPEELKNYLDAFGPRFVGLTGTDAQITAAAKAYRVYYKKHDVQGGDYTFDHSSIIYLMGSDGKFLTNYSLDQGPDFIAADLAKRLKS